jgi:hypothetical protein
MLIFHLINGQLSMLILVSDGNALTFNAYMVGKNANKNF